MAIMRILHITAYCSVFSQGGTERYIDGLVEILEREHGFVNHILAVTPNGAGRLSPSLTVHYPRSRSEKDLNDFREQCHLVVEDFQPDWIFIHTSDCMEAEVAKIAIEKGIPYLFFYHAPYWLCAHYDMQYCGCKTCHRLFGTWRCSVCMASGGRGCMFRGLLRVCAGEIHRMLCSSKDSWLHSFRYELPKKEYVVRHATKVLVMNGHDKAIMQENGIDTARIAVVPQGVSNAQIPQFKANAATERTGCLKIGYIGRATEIKGCHFLVEAIKLIPKAYPLELHLYGCDEKTEYVRHLYQMAGEDRRIVFHSMMPAADVLKEYAKLDVICIPSVIFETGPLTLFEGIYSGCSVYGSEMIGQIDTLRRYGFVVADNTPNGWAKVFGDCLNNLSSIRSSRLKCFEYRTMQSVAEELYRGLQCQK